MENNQNKNLKIIILILSLLLLVSVGYMFKLMNQLNTTETVLSNELTEKEAILNDLEELKTTYDNLLKENTGLNEELEKERTKVESLIQKVRSADKDAVILKDYKKQVKNLENRLAELIRENEALKKLNDQLVSDVDSVKTIVEEQKEYNQVLVGQNEELARTVEKGSKLSILNLKTAAYKQRSSGKEIETERASRTDLLKISFTIAENKIAKSGDKQYYIQVIDSKNNVLGEKKSVFFGDKELTYSFISSIEFKNSTLNVSESLKGSNFEKGTYFVTIFDQGESVAQSSFTLK